MIIDATPTDNGRLRLISNHKIEIDKSIKPVYNKNHLLRRDVRETVKSKESRKIGYARVSTVEQNPQMQIAALKAYGVEDDLIFVDKASGGVQAKRPNFLRALKYAKAQGSEFVVWKLDRLGRSLTGVLDTLTLLEECGVQLISLTERFENKSPMGKAMIRLLAVFAELERDLILERTHEGIKRKRERGEAHGRPIVMTPEREIEARRLLAEGVPGPDVFEAMKAIAGPKISRSGFYKWHRINNAKYRKSVMTEGGDELY